MSKYRIGGGWGRHVDWFDFDKRRIWGHEFKKPKVGDTVVSPMQSGKDAVFKVVDVEYCLDPADMFFATVEDVGYEDTITQP